MSLSWEYKGEHKLAVYSGFYTTGSMSEKKLFIFVIKTNGAQVVKWTSKMTTGPETVTLWNWS